MTIYHKPNCALYYTKVGKSRALSYTFAFVDFHLMNPCIYVIMTSIFITSYALSIIIKWTLANHTQ
jgi:hypothetical protein